MRPLLFVGALVTMTAISAAPVSAQTSDMETDREGWRVRAVLGQAFDTIGASPTAMTSAGYAFGRGLSVMGETGTFRIMPSIPIGATYDVDRVNSYHVNANVLYELPRFGPFGSYVTTGFGNFNTATIQENQFAPANLPFFRRDTHSAVNIGAGVSFRLTPWLGLAGDHRSFIVNVSPNETRRVHRFTAGVSLSVG